MNFLRVIAPLRGHRRSRLSRSLGANAGSAPPLGTFSSDGVHERRSPRFARTRAGVGVAAASPKTSSRWFTKLNARALRLNYQQPDEEVRKSARESPSF